jgi:small subunit ribosomal protein S20
MANHNSSKKSIRTTRKRSKINKSRISDIRTAVKKFETSLAAEDLTLAKDLFKTVQSKLLKGVTKKVAKLNTASRKISRLNKMLKVASK